MPRAAAKTVEVMGWLASDPYDEEGKFFAKDEFEKALAWVKKHTDLDDRYADHPHLRVVATNGDITCCDLDLVTTVDIKVTVPPKFKV